MITDYLSRLIATYWYLINSPMFYLVMALLVLSLLLAGREES